MFKLTNKPNASKASYHVLKKKKQANKVKSFI